MVKEPPKKGSCHTCGRECTFQNDFAWIPFKGEGIWYCQCRYCRAANTKRRKKYLWVKSEATF